MAQAELDYETFVGTLLADVPELEPVYEDHVAQFAIALPHVLMGDVTRFLLDAYRRSTAESTQAVQWRGVVRRLLTLLEDAAQSPDESLRNLISVSFVENLLPSSSSEWAAYDRMKELLGPGLRKELELYDPQAFG